jgi:rod shape-determining protein MreC
VYDRKTVRRRRAVLGLLVASALILLTAYFGESSNGGLHSAQRGVFSIVSPIQDVASRVLAPFRDSVNWVGDTINATGEVGDLRKERDKYRLQAAQAATLQSRNQELSAQLNVHTEYRQYGALSADLQGYNPSPWFQQVSIDVGSSDGVRQNMPVINSAGLVGLTTFVGATASIVTLVTSGNLKVGVTIQSHTGDTSGTEDGGLGYVSGLAQASVGQGNDIVVTGLSNHRIVRVGDFVVTSGTVPNTRLVSPYPAGILVGTVTRVDDAQSDAQQVHVHPAVDVRNLGTVQVLTKVNR